MYDAILAGTDGSEAATKALEHAIELAAAVDATVHVVTVVETSGSPMTFTTEQVDELNRAASELVDRVVAAHDDQDVDIRGDVRRGRAAEALLAYADEADVDLIVVGERGADGVAEAILGSTADRLVQQADHPVTIVPAGEE